MGTTFHAIKTFFGFEPIDEEFEPLAPPQTNSPEKPLKVVKNTRQFSFAEITIEAPTTYEDATLIATHLLENKPVIVNLKNLETDISKRLIDFICGTAYAINGHMMKIGDTIFLFTPANVSISNTEENSALTPNKLNQTPTTFFKQVSNL